MRSISVQKFNWSLFGIRFPVSVKSWFQRGGFGSFQWNSLMSCLRCHVSWLVKPTWGQYSLLHNHSRKGAEGAGKNIAFFRGFLAIFGSKLRFLENCIAKCAIHSVCEGARPTEEIFATVSTYSYALPLTRRGHIEASHRISTQYIRSRA